MPTPLPAVAFLAKDSPHNLGFMIMHHHHLVESWSQLDSGGAQRTGGQGQGVLRRRGKAGKLLMGMFNMAMTIAPELTRTLDLTGRRRFLDVGGGPGTYAIHFCLNNPQLHGTIYDLPTTRPFAEKTIAQFDLIGRVDFSGW